MANPTPAQSNPATKPATNRATRTWLPRILIATWLAIAGFGFSVLHSYASNPSDPGTTTTATTTSTTGSHDHSQAQTNATTTTAHQPQLPLHIRLFIHPACPCTRASVDALEQTIALSRSAFEATTTTNNNNNNTLQPNIHIIALQDASQPDRWLQTDLTKHALRLPHTQVTQDPNGQIAKQFGVTTSGHLLIHDANGKLVFTGGITPTRGHSGPNTGQTALQTAIQEGHSPWPSAPVYGCSLFAPQN